MKPILQLCGITKKFSSVIANDNIDLDIYPGEIHVLLGENGAGKSTLMKIVHGMYYPDSGKIFWKGEEVKFSSPIDAILNNIGMVYQDFRLINKLSVVENMILGLRKQRNIFINEKYAIKKLNAISEKFGLTVNPKAIVQDLPAGQKQRVEIIKILSLNPDLIILDEPTSMLTSQEVELLFTTIKSIVEEGKTVCLITHKLEEVMAIGKRITVLRDGKVVGNVLRENTNPKKLAKMMVGREVLFRIEKAEKEIGAIKLDVDNLFVKGNSEQSSLEGVSLTVHEGEILGVAGISGNGQIELAESIAGLRQVSDGKIILDNTDITHLAPSDVINLGCGYIPDDVRQNAVFLEANLVHNSIIKLQNRIPIAENGIINYKEAEKYSVKLINEYQVKASNEFVLAKQLSGGNLQKLILAREFMLNPKVIIALNPTAGVDVSAIEYIHTKLLEKRQQGCAILLISADLEELLNLSDRMIVICGGKISGSVDPKNTSPEEIGLLMGGSNPVKCLTREVAE